jgi:hypothetical protein
MFGTLAAAVVAGLMIAPRFLMSPLAPSPRAAAAPPAPALETVPEPAPAVRARPPAHARMPEPVAPRVARSTAKGTEAYSGAAAAADSQVSAARRAAMAPPVANVTDATAALRHAAETGDLGVLDRLLALQPDLNARDAAGRTPLMLAILHGQTEVVSALLAYGADPNAADTHGITPLQAARAAGRPAIIAALQRYGAR